MKDNIVEKGYTVIYDTIDGKIGFIGIDDHSGGYPFFSDRIDARNVTKEIGPAFHLLRSSRKMTTFYGKDTVLFDTMRVVRMSEYFVVVDEDEDEIFLKETLAKLSDEEIAVLRRHNAIGGAK